MLGRGLWKGGDMALIDGIAVNGSANCRLGRGGDPPLQSGYIYHYAFAMLVGVGLCCSSSSPCRTCCRHA